MNAPGQSSTRSPDLDVLERQARDAILQIVGLIQKGPASGDRSSGSAAWSLHRLTYLAVDQLGLLAGQKEGLLRPIAETSMVWPAFISPHRDFAVANKRLLETLKVGNRSLLKIVPKNGQKKQWSLSTPATKIASVLVREIEGWRCYYRAKARDAADPALARIAAVHGLPKAWKPSPMDVFAGDFMALDNFNDLTAKAWFELGWKLILRQTGGHPERFSNLREMGERRRQHSNEIGQQDKVTPATGDCNVRDGIRDRLQKAFRVIAPKAEGLRR